MIWTRSDIVDAPAASAGAAAPPRDAIGATAIGAGCVALAVIAALVQMRTTGTATPTADSLAYFAVADQIAKVGYGPALPLHWSALYPLYLLLLRRLTAGQAIDELALTSAGDAVLLVAACGVTALALVSVASRCWPERPRVQASWVAAGCATALFLCFADLRVGLRMPDALVTSLAVATVALWAHAIDRGMDLRFAAAAGLTSGLAFLTRANLLHWSIGVALVALTVDPAALRRRAAALAVFAAALTLVSAPHVVALSRARGHFVYGESGKLVFAETYGATWASD